MRCWPILVVLIGCNGTSPAPGPIPGPSPHGDAAIPPATDGGIPIADGAVPSADGAIAPGDAAPAGTDAAIVVVDAAPISPDAGPSLPPGCSASVTPSPASTPVPSQLRPSGFYRCGAYGSGGARIIAPSSGGGAVALVTDAGDAFVLSLPDLALRSRVANGSGRVTFAALSPDASVLATLEDRTGEVAFWDAASGALLRTGARAPGGLPYYDLGNIDFSPDGSRVAIADSSGVTVHDVATGMAVPFAADPSQLTSVTHVAYVAGGARLLVVHNGWFGNGPYVGGGEAYLVDASTGADAAMLDYPPYHQSPVVPAAAVSGGMHDYVALGVEEGGAAIMLFDAHTGQSLPIAQIAEQPLALSDDATRIAVRTSRYDSTQDLSTYWIEIRATADGTLLSSVQVSLSRPATVTHDLALALVGADAPHVLTAVTVDGPVDGVACGNGHGSVQAIAQTSDGATLVEDWVDGTNTTQRTAWNVATGEEVPPPSGSLDAPSGVSPDGTLEAREDPDQWSADFDLVDHATGTLVRTIGPQKTHPDGFDYAPDGALIVSSARRDPVDRWQGGPQVKLWSPGDGSIVQSLETEIAERAALFHTANELFVPGADTITHWCR